MSRRARDQDRPGVLRRAWPAKLDQRVFCRLVHHHLPAVGLHLETIAPDNIVPAIISAQWLLTLFVNVLPAGATMRVWDRVFETETRAPLFACALALLQPAAEAILTATRWARPWRRSSPSARRSSATRKKKKTR